MKIYKFEIFLSSKLLDFDLEPPLIFSVYSYFVVMQKKIEKANICTSRDDISAFFKCIIYVTIQVSTLEKKMLLLIDKTQECQLL